MTLFSELAYSQSNLIHRQLLRTLVIRSRRLVSGLVMISALTPPAIALKKWNPWVTAYYVSYSGIHPNDIDFTGITHVIHLGQGIETGFVNEGPTYWQLTNSLPDSILFFTNDGNFTGQNMVQSLVRKVHAAGAKILLSVGTPFGEDRSIIISDSAKLQTAVDHIVAFAKRWGYDGIDVDWESADKTQPQISRLTRMLRRSLDTWTPRRGILTFAFGHQDYEYYDPGLQSSIDQYNVFGYDMKQNNDNVTSFNSPLYAPPASLSPSLFNWQDNWYGTWGSTGSTIQSGVRKMMQLGFNSTKLGIGIPTYGYLWTNKSAPGQPRAGSIIDAGFMHYVEVINTLENGGVYHWVDTSKVPWIGGTVTTYINVHLPVGRLFYITYDDTNSVKAKVAWAHQFNLGGVMIYDFELGRLPTQPRGSNLPLIKAIVGEVDRLDKNKRIKKPKKNKNVVNPERDGNKAQIEGHVAPEGDDLTSAGSGTPATFFLGQNYPNPFNPTTTIPFSLPKRTQVSLKVFNALGQVLSVLVDNHLEAGTYEVTLDTSATTKYPSGIYFYRLETPEYSETKKLLLLR